MGARKPQNCLFPDLGCGLGLRASHFSEIAEAQTPTHVEWFEATSENYMGIEGGFGARPLKMLEKIRKDFPVVLHGVSLSIGSTDPLDRHYLKKLKALTATIEPEFVSDHLCWTGVGGENLHDLLPLPYTEEVIAHLVSRIDQVQDFLGRRMVFENVSSYLSFRHSTMTEWEFIAEISRRADCGILLDVNNIYVSSVNHEFDPIEFLKGIPKERVAQIHLAGHSQEGAYLIDTHDQPVSEAVWELYREATRRFGAISSMVERDANIPAFLELEKEVLRAKSIREELSEREESLYASQPFAP
jgi:uncharacterized protein (UPF0276 family)